MSDKPLLERLQVKKDRRLAAVNVPSDVDADLTGRDAPIAEAEVVLLFVRDHAQMETDLPSTAAGIRPDAILWLAYPKLSSPLAGDLSRDVIHRAAPEHGLDAVSQIAIDADWSAMRLKRL